MTVTYTSEVATVSGIGLFWKLLLRWRGSIYKLIWKEMLLYIAIYYTLRLVYQYALDAEQQKIFGEVTLYCRSYSNLIPLAFVLGFFVQIVMTRWWSQYSVLPWPDKLAVFVTTQIHGLDERGRVMRRTIMRYVNLSLVLTMGMISPRVKKRFPTLDHLVEAGFMTSNEKKIFDDLMLSITHPLYWMPLVWAGSIVTRARKEGRIRDDFAVKTLLDTINGFRGGCGELLGYDMISIPLVYTQVVTLAVYFYFASTLMGAQYVTQGLSTPDRDLYVPWFTFLQYLFYVGWLKVAETLVNPFGEDDDDFELNWLIDRNIQVSYLIVDEMHHEHPELIQDKYWDDVFPSELPYTVATEQYKKNPGAGSTAQLEMTKFEQLFVRPEEEDDDSDIGIEAIRPRTTESRSEIDNTRIDITKPFKEENPDLWTTNLTRNESSFFNMIPGLRNRQRQGSLRTISSSNSLSKPSSAELKKAPAKRFASHGHSPDTQRPDSHRSKVGPGFEIPKYPRHTSEAGGETSERLETMAEEDLSEAQSTVVEVESTIPLIPLEGEHAVEVEVKEAEEKSQAKIESKDDVVKNA